MNGIPSAISYLPTNEFCKESYFQIVLSLGMQQENCIFGGHALALKQNECYNHTKVLYTPYPFCSLQISWSQLLWSCIVIMVDKQTIQSLSYIRQTY